ncbi:hypothetical protein [Salinirubrum litoreum]|uniref:Uncharacterized protein n=1 Tax=Salinirubrum litoreum TaxID=1126234 RepID=A0ABD5RGE9_9EURY|nr:hypothetical protein [Salinirubrum litoreum]
MTSTTVPRWQRGSTVLLALLTTAVVLLGFARPDRYPPAIRTQLVVQDVLVLVVGVPALLLGVWYAARGSTAGRVVWLGALAYAAYVWLSTGLQVPFTRFFLAYAGLFALSLFTLIGGVLATDPEALRSALEDRLPDRLYAGALAVIAGGLATLWLAELVPATISATPPALAAETGPQALVSHFLDLTLVVPGLAITAGLLWRKRPWGYTLAGVGVVFGALLAPTITGATVALLFVGSVTVPAVAVVFTVLPAVLAVALAVGYLRSLAGGGHDPADRPAGATDAPR